MRWKQFFASNAGVSQRRRRVGKGEVKLRRKRSSAVKASDAFNPCQSAEPSAESAKLIHPPSRYARRQRSNAKPFKMCLIRRTIFKRASPCLRTLGAVVCSHG